MGIRIKVFFIIVLGEYTQPKLGSASLNPRYGIMAQRIYIPCNT